jgi:hypothetical protein
VTWIIQHKLQLSVLIETQASRTSEAAGSPFIAIGQSHRRAIQHKYSGLQVFKLSR